MSLRPAADVAGARAAMGQLCLPCGWGGAAARSGRRLGARAVQPIAVVPRDEKLDDEISCGICAMPLLATRPCEAPQTSGGGAPSKRPRGAASAEEPRPEERRVVELRCGHVFHMDEYCLLRYIATEYPKAMMAAESDVGDAHIRCVYCRRPFAKLTKYGLHGSYEDPSELEELMASWARIGYQTSPVRGYEEFRASWLQELKDYNQTIDDNRTKPIKERTRAKLANEEPAFHELIVVSFRDTLHEEFIEYKLSNLTDQGRRQEFLEAFKRFTKIRSLYNDLEVVLQALQAGVNSSTLEGVYDPWMWDTPNAEKEWLAPLFLGCIPAKQWRLGEVQEKLLDLVKTRPTTTTVPAGVLAHTPILQASASFVQFVIERIPVGHHSYSQIRKCSPYNTSVSAVFALADTKVVEQPVVHLPGLRRDGLALKYLPSDVRNNFESVREAVRQNGMALRYAGPDPRGDFAVVMAAVWQSGDALQYARQDFKGTSICVRAAAKSSKGSAVRFADRAILADRTFQNELLRLAPASIRYLDYTTDRELWKTALRSPEKSQYSEALKVAAMRPDSDLTVKPVLGANWVLGDLELMMMAVEGDGLCLSFAQRNVKSVRRIVLAAVRQNGLALQYADDVLRGDYEVVLAALAQTRDAFYYADVEKFKQRGDYDRLLRELGWIYDEESPPSDLDPGAKT